MCQMIIIAIKSKETTNSYQISVQTTVTEKFDRTQILVILPDLTPTLANKTLRTSLLVAKVGIKSYKITIICVYVKLYSY